MVNFEIQAGIWRNPEGCYWARLAGVSGDLSDIIANGGNANGPTLVEIDPSDLAFHTSCGGWTRAGWAVEDLDGRAGEERRRDMKSKTGDQSCGGADGNGNAGRLRSPATIGADDARVIKPGI